MIPYFIQRAVPNDDIRNENINITTGCSEKQTLKKDIITSITTNMYEFCSEQYGYDIRITSYYNFCNQFWEIAGYKLAYWQQIYRVFYFENNEWIEWDVLENADEIYGFYAESYSCLLRLTQSKESGSRATLPPPVTSFTNKS